MNPVLARLPPRYVCGLGTQAAVPVDVDLLHLNSITTFARAVVSAPCVSVLRSFLLLYIVEPVLGCESVHRGRKTPIVSDHDFREDEVASIYFFSLAGISFP
jgi:hypothetical protein